MTVDREQPDLLAGPITVLLRGASDSDWREVELTLTSGAICFSRDGTVHDLAEANIEGLSVQEGQLVLHTSAGTAYLIAGTTRVREIAHALESRITALPEVARALRALGDRRVLPGAEHDEFFAPLLDAKRSAVAFEGLENRMRAFDAPRISASLDAAITGFARRRFESYPPERRSLEQILREQVEPVHIALLALESASRAVDEAPDSRRFASWRGWCGSLGDVFQAADRAWRAMAPVLASSPPKRASLWKRLFRGAGARLLLPLLASAHIAAQQWR